MTALIYCPTCATWTPHALNASGTEFVCGCGCTALVIRLDPLLTVAEQNAR